MQRVGTKPSCGCKNGQLGSLLPVPVILPIGKPLQVGKRTVTEKDKPLLALIPLGVLLLLLLLMKRKKDKNA